MASPRKYLLHSQHEWVGEPHVFWTKAEGPTRSDTFVVDDISNCLYLKLCGFVDSEQAVVEDVCQGYVRLNLGGSPFKSLFSRNACSLNMEIRFRPTEADHNPQAEVEVVIHDRRWVGQSNRFESAARRVLCQLKAHLMANY